MSNPDVSIIILTKNGDRLFSEVLAALFACYDIDLAEIIVIDSGSTDQTLSYAESYLQVRVHKIPPEEFSHGRTRNLGASLAKGRVLVYLVQDATPVNRDFLRRLVAPLSDPRVAAVYGRQLPRAATNPVERFFLKATYPEFPQTRSCEGSGPVKIRSIFFSNVASAIRRAAWDRFPFDGNLIMSEDQQWAKEVLRAGYQIIYEPKAAVYHSHNYGLRQIFQRNFDSGTSLQGLVDDSIAQMAGYELKHLGAGIKELALGGDLLWIPDFLLCEAARSLGFFLGQKSHLLPTPVKRAFSLHKYYWGQPGHK